MSVFYSAFGIRNTYLRKVTALTITWILGLLAGVFCLNQSPTYLLIDSSYLWELSGIGLTVSLAFPILLSFILLKLICFYAVLPLVFVKAFSFMFCFGNVFIAFGDAGWLVSRLIFFSDCILVLLLLVHWFCSAIGERWNRTQCFTAYIIVPVLIGCFDYFVITPFWVTLVNY